MNPVQALINRLIPLCALIMPLMGHGQTVGVTMSLGTNRLAVGQTTTLRIFAQVLPEFRADSAQIFSWYVDVLNANSSLASADYDGMSKAYSDNDPVLSSNGFSEGGNRRGIYDTFFLSQPGAGTSNAVELMSIPVHGVAPGRATFSVQRGSGVTALREDFIVAPLAGGTFLAGGDYSSAQIELEVTTGSTALEFSIDVEVARLSGGTNQFTITWPVEPGYDYYVEYVDHLGEEWQTFPGGPHNSGIYVDITTLPIRFYRVRAVPAGGGLNPFSISIVSLFQTRQLLLSYPVQAGYDYKVEYRDDLQSPTWQTLSGGPYNTGSVTISNPENRRFFRVRADKQ